MGCDGMGCDGMECDGMGWDGMGWDVMGKVVGCVVSCFQISMVLNLCWIFQCIRASLLGQVESSRAHVVSNNRLLGTSSFAFMLSPKPQGSCMGDS